MRVVLGVTGASGAPYAERLLRALAAVDQEGVAFPAAHDRGRYRKQGETEREQDCQRAQVFHK